LPVIHNLHPDGAPHQAAGGPAACNIRAHRSVNRLAHRPRDGPKAARIASRHGHRTTQRTLADLMALPPSSIQNIGYPASTSKEFPAARTAARTRR
jgi:hypothetical protein